MDFPAITMDSNNDGSNVVTMLDVLKEENGKFLSQIIKNNKITYFYLSCFDRIF